MLKSERFVAILSVAKQIQSHRHGNFFCSLNDFHLIESLRFTMGGGATSEAISNLLADFPYKKQKQFKVYLAIKCLEVSAFISFSLDCSGGKKVKLTL